MVSSVHVWSMTVAFYWGVIKAALLRLQRLTPPPPPKLPSLQRRREQAAIQLSRRWYTHSSYSSSVIMVECWHCPAHHRRVTFVHFIRIILTFLQHVSYYGQITCIWADFGRRERSQARAQFHRQNRGISATVETFCILVCSNTNQMFWGKTWWFLNPKPNGFQPASS